MCDLSLQVFLQENNGLCKKKEEKKKYGHMKVQEREIAMSKIK
jgi:hypothetical protein